MSVVDSSLVDKETLESLDLKTASVCAFDHDNPLHVMVEQFSYQIMSIYAQAGSITIFNELSEREKFSSFVNGTISALATIIAIAIQPEYRGESAAQIAQTLVDIAKVTALQHDALKARNAYTVPSSRAGTEA